MGFSPGFLLNSPQCLVGRKLRGSSDPLQSRKEMDVQGTNKKSKGVIAGLSRGARVMEVETLFGQKVSPGISLPIFDRVALGDRQRLRWEYGFLSR